MEQYKKFLCHLLPVFITLFLVAGNVAHANACTAVYVGSEVSEDGTTLIAKSNDNQSVWGNHVTITERVENKPGRIMPVDFDATVFAELPATTYRYTSTPWMDSAAVSNGLVNDAAICSNEHGVMVIMAITAFSNKAALAADPLVEHGLTENTAVDLVTCQSSTAREATEVLLSLIDKYGSSEVNIALIADQKETWYIEMYSGHQYVAVKLPTDKVSVFGNEFLLQYASDYEEHIFSKDLEKQAVENGFAVYGKNNELDLFATFSGEEVVINYSHMRTWIGHEILAPADYEDYKEKDLYPLCFSPEKEVSLQDVMSVIRNRYEGTPYSPDETGRGDMRVIGTDTAMSVHIAQIYHDLPKEMSCVTWESTGPVIYGVFVPISNAATSISEPYGRNQSAEQAGIFDTDNYPYYRFKELTTLCVEKDKYKIYGIPVRNYWNKAETEMIKGLRTVLGNVKALDQETAAQYITEYCNQVQTQAYDDAGTLLNNVRWYMSLNSNTMKNGRNPETHEATDGLQEIDPMEVSLDASVYGTIPEIPEQAQKKGDSSTAATIAVLAALGIAAAILLVRKRKRADRTN